MIRILLVMVVGIVATAQPLRADETSHRQAAMDLFSVLQMKEQMMAGVNAALELDIQRNPTLLPYRDVYQAWAKSFLWEAIAPKMLDLYVANFTEAELRELKVFYQTPTGKKSLMKIGELFQKGAEIGQQCAQEHHAELQQMIRERAFELDGAASPTPN